MALSCSIQSRAACVTLVASAVATLAAAGLWLAASASAHRDPCSLPEGTPQLAPAAQTEVVQRVLACRDLEAHRITLHDYRMLLGLDAPPKPPAPQWASSVRSFSTEYTTSSWSAAQALGAPDVYPKSGDDARAWASLEADAGDEVLEVGFAQPQRTRALQIYETYNPGAIRSVELITASGARISVAPSGREGNGGSAISTFGTTCTTQPIVAARITLASAKVAGWNEIDAVGALPCP